jgi:hypothetical protein
MNDPIDARVVRLKRLRVNPDDVWQGAIVRSPTWITGEPGEPYRPHTAVWTSRAVGRVHMGDVVRPGEQRPEQMLDALFEFSRPRLTGWRPGRIEVEDPVLGEHLRHVLAGVVGEIHGWISVLGAGGLRCIGWSRGGTSNRSTR